MGASTGTSVDGIAKQEAKKQTNVTQLCGIKRA
jgi:hypothetical protein